MNKIKRYADILKLTQTRNTPEEIIHKAQIDKPSYTEFMLNLIHREVLHRQKTDLDRRMKLAWLPKDHNLEKYDFNMANGITVPQLKQLRELIMKTLEAKWRSKDSIKAYAPELAKTVFL